MMTMYVGRSHRSPPTPLSHERTADDPGTVGETSGIGACVVEPDEGTGHRGLAIGPMARVSQIQLVQPVLSITWAALLLREELTASTVLGGIAVIVCAGIAVRIRLDRNAFVPR